MGKAEQGRVNGLGLTSLNSSSGLWTIELVSSCLVPGPRIIQCRGNTGLVCVKLDMELIWGDRLGTGWFVYERHAPRQALSYP